MIDPVAPRYTALDCTENLVQVVVVDDFADESKEVPLHPKVTLLNIKRFCLKASIFFCHIDLKK